MQLVQAEPGQLEVEVEALQRPQLLGQQVLVPARIQGQTIVGDDVGALLRLGQVGEFDHRDGGHPQLAGRQEPPVAGDDAGVAVDQDRVRPAELEQAGGDLGDLLGAVGSRVPLVGAEPVDGPVFQFSGQPDGGVRTRGIARSGRFGRVGGVLGLVRAGTLGVGGNLFHNSPTLREPRSPAPASVGRRKEPSCNDLRILHPSGVKQCPFFHRPSPRALAIAFRTSRSISSRNHRSASFSAVSTKCRRGSIFLAFE